LWKQVAKGTSILFVGAVINKFFTIAYRYLAMRYLKVEEYGTFALIMSFTVFVLAFGHFYSGTALSRWIARTHDQEERKRLFANSMFLTLISSVTISPLLLWFFMKNVPFMKYNLFIIFCGFIALALMDVIKGALRGLLKWINSVSVDILFSLFKLLLIALGIWVYSGLVSLNLILTIYFGAGILSFALSIGFIKGYVSKLWQLLDRNILLRLFQFSKNLTLSWMCLYGMSFYSRWILSRTSSVNTALYDGAFVFYSFFQMLTGAINTAVIPSSASVYFENEGKTTTYNRSELSLIYKLVQKTFGFLLAVILLFYIVHYLRIDKIIFHLLKLDKFYGSLSVMLIVVWALPFEFYYNIGSGLLIGKGKSDLVLKVSALALVWHLLITLMMNYFWGLTGVAFGYVFTVVFLFLVLMIEFKKGIHGEESTS